MFDYDTWLSTPPGPPVDIWETGEDEDSAYDEWKDNIVPHYEGGIGFENTRIASLTKRLGRIITASDSNSVGESIEQKSNSVTKDSAIMEALEIAKKALERQIYIMMDKGALVGEIVADITKRQADRIYLDDLTRGVLP